MKLIMRKNIFNESFDDFLTNNYYRTPSRVMRLDIYKEGDSYHLDIEPPVFGKDDLKNHYNRISIHFKGTHLLFANGLHKEDFYVIIL